MNLSDIITLAKQGYKPGDIRELIELAKTAAPEPFNPPPKGPEPLNPPPNGPEPLNPPPNGPEPAANYEEIINNLKAENEKILADLRAAQEHNRSQSSEPEPEVSREDKLKDIARAFWR